MPTHLMDVPNGRRLERVVPRPVFVSYETLRRAASPVNLTSDAESEVLAIPAPVLARALEDHPAVARDLPARLHSGRQALEMRREAA